MKSTKEYKEKNDMKENFSHQKYEKRQWQQDLFEKQVE